MSPQDAPGDPSAQPPQVPPMATATAEQQQLESQVQFAFDTGAPAAPPAAALGIPAAVAPSSGVDSTAVDFSQFGAFPTAAADQTTSGEQGFMAQPQQTFADVAAAAYSASLEVTAADAAEADPALMEDEGIILVHDYKLLKKLFVWHDEKNSYPLPFPRFLWFSFPFLWSICSFFIRKKSP